jgi:probable F420-dependent oxidoreductase
VRVGVHLPQFREPVTGAQVAEAARAAEAAGLDDVWVSDHVILPTGSTRPPARFHEPLAVLGWAAAVTSRVGLGTSVLVAPYRPPALLAAALASLDALSGGRVIAGLASGWMAAEFAALGIPFRQRGARTDEAIAVCRALWRGEDRFAGRFTRFEGMGIRPGPARPGGPPVWVGGNTEAGIARAARLGDGWHTNSGPERLGERIAALHAALAREGRDRAGFTLSVRVRADPATAAALAPALRELGVDHLLVDLPGFEESFAEQAAELAASVRG